MKIFIVMGRTGEYSDSREWVVCAFVSEAEAKDYVDKCSKMADELMVRRGSRYSYNFEPDLNPLDPYFQMDYTGTSYWAEPTELKIPEAGKFSNGWS